MRVHMSSSTHVVSASQRHSFQAASLSRYSLSATVGWELPPKHDCGGGDWRPHRARIRPVRHR
ncbi:hypothetical protein Vau01_124150 [Virgisporangium aurantiacum]|uniref:Uncharacterized protein n=1 Tax=Virgisporangium aurantiacum TaxID=175570 RepID=A0A8J4E819_9ACTN|nr:hypothetical protein Vau01_124150 [Virgisporangium aurantiacum]